MSSRADRPVVLGITGASGAPYSVSLLRALNASGTPVDLIISQYGLRLLHEEAGIEGVDALRAATGDWSRVRLFQPENRGATPASGSAPTRGMVICPCSMGTLASIASGTSRNLIERAADVTLKERRPLLVVFRETPLSLIHLENMTRLARAGATIMPAAPGFYHRPSRLEELVDFIVFRILDHLEIEVDAPRWSSDR